MQVVGSSERATLAGVSMPLAAIRRINRKYGADADTYSSVLVRAQSADDVGEVAAGVRKLGLEIDDTERRYAVQIGAAVELVTLALSLLAALITGLAAVNTMQAFYASVGGRTNRGGAVASASRSGSLLRPTWEAMPPGATRWASPSSARAAVPPASSKAAERRRPGSGKGPACPWA